MTTSLIVLATLEEGLALVIFTIEVSVNSWCLIDIVVIDSRVGWSALYRGQLSRTSEKGPERGVLP